MKNCITMMFVALAWMAQAQIQTPQPSPAGSVSSVVGLTTVKIDYSRPQMKGRKIFGDGDSFLTPYGQLWRTGANNGTIISFSDDVTVEGNAVAKGEYLIFTWPGATEWTVSLYKDLSIGGNTAAYDKSKEAANFKVKAQKLAETVETLTLQITDIAADSKSANVQIAWENTSVKFKVGVEFDSQVMKAIEANTKVSPGNYITAANYYYSTKKDLKKAIEWMELGIAQGNPNAFWNIHQLAKMKKDAGDKAGAKATAQKSLDLAKKAESDFGYIKMNEDLISS
ncbi:MAG: DUF2911 domain-containing protein, partial [Cyclobacteriaceae bacterium]